MSRNYKFHNPEGLYFVSFAVVDWLDVFTRNEYKEILLDSLRYCQSNKGIEIFAWCIMTNHVHLVYRTVDGFKPESVLGDFKSVTSRKLVKAIQENPKESRIELLLQQFKKAASETFNVKNYQFWRHDNKPIELWINKVILRRLTIYIKILWKQAWYFVQKIIFTVVLWIMQMKKACWKILY